MNTIQRQNMLVSQIETSVIKWAVSDGPKDMTLDEIRSLIQTIRSVIKSSTVFEVSPN